MIFDSSRSSDDPKAWKISDRRLPRVRPTPFERVRDRFSLLMVFLAYVTFWTLLSLAIGYTVVLCLELT